MTAHKGKEDSFVFGFSCPQAGIAQLPSQKEFLLQGGEVQGTWAASLAFRGPT